MTWGWVGLHGRPPLVAWTRWLVDGPHAPTLIVPYYCEHIAVHHQHRRGEGSPCSTAECVALDA